MRKTSHKNSFLLDVNDVFWSQGEQEKGGGQEGKEMKKEKEERRKSKGGRKKKQFNNGKERARSMAVKSQPHISSKSHTPTSHTF